MKVMITITIYLMLCIPAFAGSTTTNMTVNLTGNSYCTLNVPTSIDLGTYTAQPMGASIPVSFDYECGWSGTTAAVNIGTSNGTYNTLRLGNIGSSYLIGWACKPGNTDCVYSYNLTSFGAGSYTITGTASPQTLTYYVRFNGCATTVTSAPGSGVCEAGVYNGAIDTKITF